MSDQLKILIISKQYPPTMGGGGAHASYLANELSLKEEVQVHVLTSAIGTKPHQKDNTDKNLVEYRVNFGHTESLHYDGAIKKGLQLCESIEPDIIHGQHIAGALIGLHLKASFGMPLVVTLHKTPKSRWDETITRRDPIYSYLKLLSNLEMIDLFIAGSEAFAQELKDVGVKDEKIRLIYHGIPIKWYKKMAYDDEKASSIIRRLKLSPTEYFSIDAELEDDLIKSSISGKLKEIFKTKGFSLSDNASATKEKENEWVIIDEEIFIVKKEDGKLNIYPVDIIFCPSRLDEKRKGIETFIKACGLLRPQIKDRNFIFLITGTAKNKAEKRYKKELERIASTRRIKNRVRFISFKADELPALYRLARVCVLPSIREGLGLVLLEALAVRTPVVGSNVPGINEVIETNGEHGLLFELGDYKELGDQLVKLLTNDDLRQKLKREGFKRVKRHFNAELMADKHLECYNELI
jgi:glycosyltransferase involved in cell wall biosynthesis